MSSPEKIMAVLRHVLDPELGVNIVDLGLVYDVDVVENRAQVRMTLTTPGCPLHDSIIASVGAAIRHFCADIEQVAVQLVWEPRWHPDRMSPLSRKQLGWEA
jgi:metal-sulfur cluster biosynthetic enzyme